MDHPLTIQDMQELFTSPSQEAPKRGRGRPRKVVGRVSTAVTQQVENPEPVQSLSRRTRYTAEEDLALIRLCVQYSSRFVKPFGEFWKFIRSEFEKSVGKPMSDPLAKMNRLVKDRETVVAQQRKESGTVQEETDTTQALDQWRKTLHTVEEQKERRREIQKQKRTDSVLASLQESNMMKTLREKRCLSPESATDDLSEEQDEDDIEGTVTSQSTPSGGFKNKPRKRQRIKAASATAEVVSAIGTLGQRLENGMIRMSEAVSTQKQAELQSLEQSWNDRLHALEEKTDKNQAIHEQTNAMMTQLLGMVQQMVPPQKPQDQ